MLARPCYIYTQLCTYSAWGSEYGVETAVLRDLKIIWSSARNQSCQESIFLAPGFRAGGAIIPGFFFFFKKNWGLCLSFTAGEVAGSLAGMAPMINCLSLDDTLPHTPLFLLPRKLVDPTNSSPASKITSRDWRIPLKVPDRMWFVHTANAFEEVDADSNLRVVLDGTACSYEWFSLLHMFGKTN